VHGFRKYGRGFPWHAGCLNHRSLSGCIGGTGVPPVISSWTGKMPAPLNSQEQGPKGDTVLAKRCTECTVSQVRSRMHCSSESSFVKGFAQSRRTERAVGWNYRITRTWGQGLR
jgi:hypothetical protein